MESKPILLKLKEYVSGGMVNKFYYFVNSTGLKGR